MRPAERYSQLERLAQLVAEMRAAQKAYLRTRDATDLTRATRFAREVDLVLKKLTEPVDLFND